jgi:hypothetical protein
MKNSIIRNIALAIASLAIVGLALGQDVQPQKPAPVDMSFFVKSHVAPVKHTTTYGGTIDGVRFDAPWIVTSSVLGDVATFVKGQTPCGTIDASQGKYYVSFVHGTKPQPFNNLADAKAIVALGCK